MARDDWDYWDAPKAPPPEARAAIRPPTPGVWPWFIIYCVAMALVYLAVAALFGAMPFFAEAKDDDERMGLMVVGGLIAVVCLAMMVLFALGPVLPKRPWVWIYNIVLIGLGMTSVCTMAASIPLLIFWLRPETRRFYGRT